ncbi:hypothetical protein HV237_03215 [Citrobacter sp. RHBSTW-00570]|nr:hypothetical protein [Citrobacter sp. RHBSTW-00570]QLV66999.1 hypothetical protein HV237_03215 [Citrobacter sp. RHBSTW-00570]
MNLEELSLMIRKNLAAWVAVIITCAAAGAFLINQYVDLYDKKNELDHQIKEFYAIKNNKEEELLKREKYIFKQEIFVKNEKESYEKRLNELNELKKNYDILSAELNTNAQNASLIIQRQVAEDKLRALMSEFSAMGISLNQPPECKDKESRKQYNIAKAKLSEARSFALANELYDDYQGFFNAN